MSVICGESCRCGVENEDVNKSFPAGGTRLCVCKCCVEGNNELQMPWSCCGPSFMSELLIGEYELYDAAAETSATLRMSMLARTN